MGLKLDYPDIQIGSDGPVLANNDGKVKVLAPDGEAPGSVEGKFLADPTSAVPTFLRIQPSATPPAGLPSHSFWFKTGVGLKFRIDGVDYTIGLTEDGG